MLGYATHIPRIIKLASHIPSLGMQGARFSSNLALQKLGLNQVDHSTVEGKINVLMTAGFTSDIPSYYPLLEPIKKNDINIIEIPNSLQGLQAAITRRGIKRHVQSILEALDNSNVSGAIHLLGHSMGGLVNTLLEIESQKHNTRYTIATNTALSSPFNGTNLASIPGISTWSKAVRDMHPESEIIQKIQAEGRVDHNFVTPNDILLNFEEQRFKNATQETILNNFSHFDYMYGTQEQIDMIAKAIRSIITQ